VSNTKRFLLIFFGAALVVWLGINFTLGPPGLSSAYLYGEDGEGGFKADHDHYLDIIKSGAYKLYEQRPHLNGPGQPGVSEDLAENIEFVEHYKAREAFQAEEHRRALYDILFDFFNAALVVVLAVYFGRKPLLKFLDEKIADLREKMEALAEARKDAEARRHGAEDKLARLSGEEQQIAAATEERLAKEMAELDEANQRGLEIMQRELEDRKRDEEKAAAMRVKEELVNQAIAKLIDDYKAKDSAEQQARLVEEFSCDVEKLQ
jgi:F0F1-type ATP synthase membrane subunit b/b'